MKKFALSFVAASFMFTVMSTGAFADSSKTLTGNTVVNPGSLDFVIPDSFSFGEIELTGEKIVRNTGLTPLTITDARGNGYGWNLKVSATPLKNGNSVIENAIKLTSAPAISSVEGATNDGVSVSNGTLNDSGFVLASAIADRGMGKFTFTFADDALELTLLPKNTYAGTYSTTITWDLQTGPTR